MAADTSLQEERLVELLSSSFTEFLLHSASDDTGKDPILTITDDVLEQAAAEIRRRLPSSDEAVSQEKVKVILQEAKRKAESQWRNKKSNSSSAKADQKKAGQQQMSLFLTGTGGGLLSASFMTWDRIQDEATNDKEKLTMLQKVEYIDDVIPDWCKAVCPFLQACLLQTDLAIDCIRLHRKWFHMTRGSAAEFRSIQKDLVNNLIEVAVKLTSDWKRNVPETQQNPSKTVRLCCEYAIDMFTDLLHHHSVADDNTNSIGKALWAALERDFAGGPVARCLVEPSPDAAWFCLWTRILSPDEILALVTPKEDRERCLLSYLFSFSLELMGSLKENSQNLPNIVFALSTLRSVLVSLRVLRFPWKLLSLHDNPAPVAEVKKLELFDAYYQLLQYLLATEAKEEEVSHAYLLRSPAMCIDAMETMLWGCIGDSRLFENGEKTVYQIMIGRLAKLHGEIERKSGQSVDRSISRLLADVLGQLRRAESQPSYR
jgi:hypothetical protein